MVHVKSLQRTSAALTAAFVIAVPYPSTGAPSIPGPAVEASESRLALGDAETAIGGDGTDAAVAALASAPLIFEPNVGQTDEQAEFLCRLSTGTLFLTRDSAVFSLHTSSRPDTDGAGSERGADRRGVGENWARNVVRLRFEGARGDADGKGERRLESSSDYFLGDDASRWHVGVPHYASVRYESLYEGIDLLYYSRDGALEYDFVVAPGASPEVISMRLEGADTVEIDASGDLLARSSTEALRMRRPALYQDVDGAKVAVPGRFVLGAGGEVRFGVGAYDRARPLVIDPVLDFSSYGPGMFVFGIVGAPDGSFYIGGTLADSAFPPGNALGTQRGGPFDIAVVRLDRAGATVLYSAFIGGSQSDFGRQIALDASGAVILTGSTASADFPTVNAFQPRFGGSPDPGQAADGVVVKIAPTGRSLVYATYAGGSDYDDSPELALDTGGNAYVALTTSSADFPTRTPVQPVYAGNKDVAFLKIGPGGELVFASFLGGRFSDDVGDVDVDRDGSLYVAGFTGSSDFPVVNAFLAQGPGGRTSAFLAKLAPSGTALEFSTYYGGPNGDTLAYGVAVDSSESAYLAGTTTSSQLPTTSPFQGAIAGGRDAFVAKLAPSGRSLVYGSYLGGRNDDFAFDVASGPLGTAYLAGRTASSDFRVVDALQTYAGGDCGGAPCADAFVAEIGATGALVFSTFLGGPSRDEALRVRTDGAQGIFVVFTTDANDFPTTAGALLTDGSVTSGFFRITTGVVLDWEPPRFVTSPGTSDTTEGPQRLRVLPGDAVVNKAPQATKRGQLPEVIAYKVYTSTDPDVETGDDGDVLDTLGPDRTSLGPITPTGGTYFVVTACLSDGTETDGSNPASVNVPSPVISTLKVTSKKVVATGTGFENGVAVALDRTLFRVSPRMKSKPRKRTKLVQKGPLTSGDTVGQYFVAHDQKVLVLFQDRSTGGYSGLLFPPERRR
jgi:hypothetical protein